MAEEEDDEVTVMADTSAANRSKKKKKKKKKSRTTDESKLNMVLYTHKYDFWFLSLKSFFCRFEWTSCFSLYVVIIKTND